MSAYAIPANSSIIFLDSLTVGNASTLTIPNTATVLVQNTNNPHITYWDAIYQVPADFATTSLTLVDIPGFSFSVLANSLYEVEIMIVEQLTGAFGCKVGWHFSSSLAGFVAMIDAVNTAGNNQVFMPLVDVLSSTLNGFAGDSVINIKGSVKTGANAGTISIRCAKVTSGTMTVYQKSVLKTRKL
jgi:hypothetical protein